MNKWGEGKAEGEGGSAPSYRRSSLCPLRPGASLRVLLPSDFFLLTLLQVRDKFLFGRDGADESSKKPNATFHVGEVHHFDRRMHITQWNRQ